MTVWALKIMYQKLMLKAIIGRLDNRNYINNINYFNRKEI
jgi:hypothetical protein